MKNTLKIGIKDTTTEVLMYSSYDDGTNRLFVGLEASIEEHPWIQIGSSAKIYATSNDWRYEIEPTTWRGDSTFTVTAGDDNNAGTVYTISQVPAAVTSNIGLEHTSGNTYRLTYTVGSGIDTANDIVTFASSDVEDGQATAWTNVAKLESGETHASMFAKISQMFKNVRYLYKTLGNTDLSAIGDGTVTGAISTLNTNTNPAFGKTTLSFSTVAGNTVTKGFTIPKGGVYLVNLNCYVQAGANDLFQFIVNDVNGRVWGGSSSIHNYTAAALGDTTAFSIIVDTRGLSSNYTVNLVTWARYVYSAGANIKYIKIRS